MTAPKVFISYSHDSPLHSERVLALTWALRNNGIDVELDQFHNEEILDWPRWCRQQIKREQSDYILCICTPEYQRRIEGGVPPEKGKGVYWEGSLLDDEIYNEKRNRRFVPILFDGEPETSILDFLRGWTFCRLSQFTLSDSGYEHLLRILTGQTKVEKNALGTVPRLPTLRAPVGSLSAPVVGFKADISRIFKYAPAELIGREGQTKFLNDAWDKAVRGETKRPHVLTYVALGGEGKTSLVSKWAADLAHQGWPGCHIAFAWSFYHQGTDEKSADSSDLFLKEALNFFGDPTIADSALGAYEKGRRLAQLVGERRALLTLDGVEPLQYPPGPPMDGKLKDDGIAELLKGLAATNRGLCVVTTRYSIPDLKAFWQTSALEIELKRLSVEGGVALLRKLGVRKESGSETEFEKLVEDVHGHALTLNLLGTYLRDAHAGDIRKRDLVKFEEADTEEQGGHAFRVMDAYVKSFESEGKNGLRALAILRLLGLFDRPATADCFMALLKAPKISNLTEPLVGTSNALRNLAFTRLETARLLTVNRDSSGSLISLDAHPLIREYFKIKIRSQHVGAWRAAHRRLYKHLVATTHEGVNPTLEKLQPLYQAVSNGCHAELQQETCEKVFVARILRGTGRSGFYNTRVLGAFGSDLGAVACFFEQPWSQPSPLLMEDAQAALLGLAAFDLRALGRLTEALEPLRADLEMRLKAEDWKNSSACANNLSELELTLGDLAGALRNAEQSVDYADRDGEPFEKIAKRTTLADALHQAGRLVDAEVVFRKAEEMQTEHQSVYPVLYSIFGYRYCNLLLADPERVAWKIILMDDSARLSKSADKSECADVCDSIFERAMQTLIWAESSSGISLLTPALDHLTLGRACLYASIFNPDSNRHRGLAVKNLRDSVEGLRRSGEQIWITAGVLSRAWLRFLEGDADDAQSDLDEAWEIAERGPMRLHMADIHLYRARLFGGMKDEGGRMKYPWDKNPDGTARGPKDDLAAARKLIEQCGYWRRKEELEDAEEAAKNW